MTDQIIRLSGVEKLTRLSEATIKRRVKAKVFPSPKSLGGRSIGWLKSEVEAWLKNRPDADLTDSPPPVKGNEIGRAS